VPVTPPANGHSQTFAAIDLGSNSFHMIVGRYVNGVLQVEDRLREMVRLGAGLDAHRDITPETQERALACLERFGQRIADLPRSHVRAVGTNTLRSAQNSAEFLPQAERALGRHIEIISGVEEARLIYRGVAHGIGGSDERRFVMDIGGGSTELIIGTGFQPFYMQSLYMGCVSMTQRFFDDGKITAKACKQAELAARMELEPVEAIYRKLGWERAIGASGSIRAVRAVVRENGWSPEGITLESLKTLRDAMVTAKRIDKLQQLPGLTPERALVFPGGVMVLLATFKALGIKSMQVSDSALREGLIHDLLGRYQHQDVRSHAVRQLAQRYHVDMEQAQRVAETAKTCARQVVAAWNLMLDSTLNWLEWGALLHEIGLDISHSQYHKHGAYIAEHSDLAGFSRQEQVVLAALIRNHRRKFSNAPFKRLAHYRTRPAQLRAILLRLAVVLHRSRNPKPLPTFTLNATEHSLTLRFPDGWLERHSLTHADLEQEAIYLKKGADFSLSFA
jgi:exopolyphosphatase/guanosine-5'-triphosphate,3'-diphosphate pyrophosphatase